MTKDHRLQDKQDTGHGIMALSREPIAHRDHAPRSGWTALHRAAKIAWHPIHVKHAHGLSGVAG